MDETTLEKIREVSSRVSNNALERLRIEEELLISLVRNSSVAMTLKSSAFTRIKDINMKQLELLGDKIEG